MYLSILNIITYTISGLFALLLVRTFVPAVRNFVNKLLSKNVIQNKINTEKAKGKKAYRNVGKGYKKAPTIMALNAQEALMLEKKARGNKRLTSNFHK